MTVPRIHGRFEGGFGWHARPGEFMERSSTALAHDGRVWLVDPLRADGIDAEIEALGTVAAVVMTLGWHDRDVDWFATLYGVPVFAHASVRFVDVRSPIERVASVVPDSPLQFVECGGRGALRPWAEAAVWWPEQRTLVTGDCLGNASYFVQPDERVAVHPVRRLSPPVQLVGLPVQRLYPGHGTSVDGDAAAHIHHALDTAMTDLPSAWLHSFRATLRRLRGTKQP